MLAPPDCCTPVTPKNHTNQSHRRCPCCTKTCLPTQRIAVSAVNTKKLLPQMLCVAWNFLCGNAFQCLNFPQSSVKMKFGGSGRNLDPQTLDITWGTKKQNKKLTTVMDTDVLCILPHGHNRISLSFVFLFLRDWPLAWTSSFCPFPWTQSVWLTAMPTQHWCTGKVTNTAERSKQTARDAVPHTRWAAPASVSSPTRTFLKWAVEPLESVNLWTGVFKWFRGCAVEGSSIFERPKQGDLHKIT